jgi:hypothetical protein
MENLKETINKVDKEVILEPNKNPENDEYDSSTNFNEKIFQKEKNINKIREDIINLLNNKETTSQIPQKIDNNILINKNIEYHKNLASTVVKKIEYEKRQMGPTGFASLGYPTFFGIVKFLGKQGINGQEFLLEKLREISLSDERFSGVTNIKQIILENGQPGYVVKIDKSKWVGAFCGPGIAFIEFNIAFVADGLSKRSVKLIENHEVYHLNNHKAGELETVINTNLKKDLIGSAVVLIQSCINMPRWIINNIKEIIKENKNHVSL